MVTVLLSGDMNLLAVLLFARIEVGGEGSRFKLVCPSDALRFLWKMDLTLDVGLLDALNGVAPVRRREDAEGDRYAGVKVQVADL